MTNIQVPSADVRRTSAVAPSAVRLAGKAFVHDQCTSARSIASNALPVSAGWRTSMLKSSRSDATGMARVWRRKGMGMTCSGRS